MSIRFNSIGSVSIKKNSTNDLQNANVTENNITISASVSEIYEGDILTFTITRDSSIINTSQNFKLICSNDSTITSYDIQKLNILNSESSNVSDDGYEFLFDISEQTKTIDIPINLDVNTNPKETDKAFKLSIYEGSSLLVTSELITIKNTVAINSVNPPISGTAESGTMLKFYKNTQTSENLFFQLDYADNTNGIWQINPSDYLINLGTYSNENTNDGLITILGTASDIAGNESQPGVLKIFLDTQEQVDESLRQLKDDGGYGPFVFEFQGVSGEELQYPKFITTTQPSVKIKNASWGSTNYSKESHGVGLYILYKNDYLSDGNPSTTTDEVISNILNYTENDTPYELQFNFASQILSTNMKQNIFFRVEDVAGNYELFEGHGEDTSNLGTSDESGNITVTVLSSAVLTPSTTKLLKGEGVTLTFDIPEIIPQLPQNTKFLVTFLSDTHSRVDLISTIVPYEVITPVLNTTNWLLETYFQTQTSLSADSEFKLGINSHRSSGITSGCDTSEYQLAETNTITIYYAELSLSQTSIVEGGSFTATIISNIPDDDSKYYYIKERFTTVTDINSSTGLSIRKFGNETVTITTSSGSGNTSLDLGLYSLITHNGTDYENLITTSVISVIHNYTVTANVTTINEGESVTFTITTTDDTVTTIYAYLNSSSTMTNSDFDEDISNATSIAVSMSSGSGTLTLNASSNTTVQASKTFSIDFTTISKGTNLATSETITVLYLEQTATPGNLSLDASYDSGTLNDNITSLTTIKLNGTVSNNNEHSIELYLKGSGSVTYILYSTTTLTPESLGYSLDVTLSSTDGIYNFKVKATEIIKRKSDFSNEYSLTLDTTAPNITIDAGENTYTLNYFTNTINITSLGSGSYDIEYNTGTPSIADNLVSILQNVNTFNTKTTIKWAIEIKENWLIKIDSQYYKFSSVSLDSSKITFSTLPELTISTSQKDLTFICIAPERNVI